MAARSLTGAKVGSRGTYEAGPDSAWELLAARPSPQLAGTVHGYTGYIERSSQPLNRLEAPGVVAKLIFCFGAPLRVGVPGGPRQAMRGSFFVPFSAQPAITEFQGEASGLEVSLTPLGARAVLGQPLDGVPGPVAELDQLLGLRGGFMAERLADLDSWDERFAAVDDFLLACLEATPEPPPMLGWAWRQLAHSGGNVAIGDLARSIGCSPAYLSRSFRHHIGLPPKTAAEILRFARADRLLVNLPGKLSLADLAQTCGYHDQSHMTRQFRRFTGVTPATYAGAMRPDFLGIPEVQR